MNLFSKLAVAAVVAGGMAAGAAAPAQADSFGVSIGFGGPSYYSGYYGGYEADRPCWFYRQYDLPAPRHCYTYFRDFYGPGVFSEGDFVFRDRGDFGRWRDRDDFRRWEHHDYRGYRNGSYGSYDRSHGYRNTDGYDNRNDRTGHDGYGARGEGRDRQFDNHRDDRSQSNRDESRDNVRTGRDGDRQDNR